MPRVIDTDRYLRFERVDAVEETAPRPARRARTASACASTSSRPDVVRVKISRGGGVRRDADVRRLRRTRSPSAVEFAVERGDGVVRVRTAALVASLWLDPFRLDVHRPDGSPVVETARDDDGRWWAYATLNDAFTRPPPLPPRGPDLRPGGEDRAPQPPAARLHAVEHGRPRPARDGRVHRGPAARRPARRLHEHRVRPLLRLDPVLPPPGRTRPARSRGRSSTTATARAYEFSRPEEYRFHFAGGQYTEYIFAGPRDAGRRRAPTRR